MQDDQMARIEHLKMLQNTIDRMANTSAAMKRYALLISAAALALAGTVKEPFILVASAAVMVVFWALDTQYLVQEKWFRDLYDAARRGCVDNFDMNPYNENVGSHPFLKVFFTWSTCLFYGPIAGIIIACTVVWWML